MDLMYLEFRERALWTRDVFCLCYTNHAVVRRVIDYFFVFNFPEQKIFGKEDTRA